jgi:hypothetical protein
VLGVMKEPKLGLNGVQPVIGLKRFSHFCDGWRMGRQVVCVGGGSGSTGVSRPIATTSGVLHELAQQLGLFVPRLKNGSDSRSQGQRWPVGLTGPGSIASVHHAVT